MSLTRAILVGGTTALAAKMASDLRAEGVDTVDRLAGTTVRHWAAGCP